jgi:ankyrin repeat protein
MTKLLTKGMMALTLALLVGVLALIPDERAPLGEKLIQATKQGDCDQLHKYLNMGADVNARDESGLTPLIWASVKGNAYAAQILLERGANANARNSLGDTALMWASIMGHEPVVELILENNADVNFKSKKNGVTALMAAAAKGHDDVVRILINHGAEVDLKDSNQNSALMLATVKGFPGVVNVLLAAGASYMGSTPSSTATALVSLTPDGEISGLELYHMGQRLPEDRFPVTDAYLWTAPSETVETVVVPALEWRPQPCFPGFREWSVRVAPSA